jgi:hypothetical protein
MTSRIWFLLMAIAQVFFAVRCLLQPEIAKAGNVRMKTIDAKLPLFFFRGMGLVCAGAAALFFCLFLKPPSN